MQRRVSFGYWIGLVAVAGLTALYAYERDIHGQYLNYERSKSELSDLRLEVQKSQQEEAAARRRVEMLRTDPVEREATVRRNKNLLRAGERIYRIEPESMETEPNADPSLRDDAVGPSEALTSGERN